MRAFADQAQIRVLEMRCVCSLRKQFIRLVSSEFGRICSNAGVARKYPVFSIQDSECGFSCFLFMLLQPNAGYARKYSVFRIQYSECGFSCSFLTLRVRKGLIEILPSFPGFVSIVVNSFRSSWFFCFRRFS